MKKMMLVSILAAAMFIIGCGGAVVFDAPEIDTVVMEETSVTVSWIVDTSVEEDPDFSGYNVYVSTDSATLMVDDGEDLNKDNATAITTNSYTITDLEDTLMYYIQVRTVNIDDEVGGYNATQPFVEASPRPEFTVHLKLELGGAQNEDSCALRFETAEVLSESLDVFPGADVFFEFFSVGGEDTTQVNSASRRDSLTGYTHRVTVMYNYGPEDFDEFSEFDESDITLDHIHFIVDDLIVFQTEEGNYVKLVIDAYDDVNQTIDVTYAYQNIPDYPFFSKGALRNEQ